jgi:hypothetical protein
MVHHLSMHVIPLLISTLVCFSIGSFWFSPALFGVKWRELLGKPKEETITIFSFLLFVFVIFAFNIAVSAAVDLTGTRGMFDGITIGFFLWLGFCVTTVAVQFLFEGRSLKLFFMISGYLFFLCIISATMFALWR